MELVLAGSAAQLHSPVFNFRPKSLVRDFSRPRLHSLKFRSWHRLIDYSFHNFHKRLTLMRAKPLQSSLSSNSEVTLKLAILLEVEGVLADVHKFGHRRGFNLAFQEFNLECANWSEPVYADLLRHAGGAEESMLRVFFDRIGWPSSLPSNEKGAFIHNIIKAKQRALEKLAASGDLPLRPGLMDFVDEVLEAKVPVVVVAAYSKSGEQVARSLIAQLGRERTNNITVVGEAEVENSAYGQFVLGDGVSGGIDEQLTMEVVKAVAAEKQQVAEEVANMLAVSVNIDTSITESYSETLSITDTSCTNMLWT